MHHINIYFYQIDFLVLISDFKKNEFLDLVLPPLLPESSCMNSKLFISNAFELLSHYSFEDRYDLEIIEMEWKLYLTRTLCISE